MRRRPPAVQRYRDAFAERDLAHELEGMIARAWAPLLVVDLGGWELRSAKGFSRLSNSVRPHTVRGHQPLAERLAAVERFYAARDLDPSYQISPAVVPRDLDRALEGHGYVATPPVEVRTTDIDHAAGLGVPDAGRVVVDADPEQRWLPAWSALTAASPSQLEVVRGLFRRARVGAAYAVLSRDGQAVAVARGVSYGGWLGLDYLTAAREHRDAAAGAALAGALGRWALAAGAVRAYTHHDLAAPRLRELRAELSWERSFQYRFRVKDRALTQGPRRGTSSQTRTKGVG